MKKRLVGVALVLVAVSLGSIQPVEACTRAVYIGPDQMVITGRTMDWKEDIMATATAIIITANPMAIPAIAMRTAGRETCFPPSLSR